MNNLVIIVPVLGRAHTFKPLIVSIYAATPAARVVFMATESDTAAIAELESLGVEHYCLPARRVGDYAAKINAGVSMTSESLIFMGACDLRFHPGWFELATARLNDRIQVIGTNDLGNPRTRYGHSTHSLLTRDYAGLGTFDDPSKVLHEGYAHEYVDDEFVGTARKRGAYRHCLDVIVEHLHPSWGKAPSDAGYRAQSQRMRQSRPLFKRRSASWT